MLSRRQFVTSPLAAGLALASQKAIAQPAKRTIVDAQVHLWKAESEDWKWVPGAKPQMPEPFTIEKVVPLMDQAGVDRVVIVPPSWLGDRNDYGLEAARRYPNRFAVMGRIALQDPQSATLLPKWKEQSGMLGVRISLLSDVTMAWLDGRNGRLVLARSREGGSARHVSCAGTAIDVCPYRRAPPTAHAHH